MSVTQSGSSGRFHVANGLLAVIAPAHLLGGPAAAGGRLRPTAPGCRAQRGGHWADAPAAARRRRRRRCG